MTQRRGKREKESYTMKRRKSAAAAKLNAVRGAASSTRRRVKNSGLGLAETFLSQLTSSVVCLCAPLPMVITLTVILPQLTPIKNLNFL